MGKTELAKTLARELYHDEKALITLDMSEFSESHSTSKLLGSPAGYIGHKDRNRFLDDIKQKPYCVVLFDEFDKAHRDVAKLLLQILDEGKLTDSGGKKIHFNHAIIILTTNLGAELFKSAGIGFGKNSADAKERDRAVLNKLKEEFSAALINRLGSIQIFSPLTTEATQQIISNNISSLSDELKKERQISIHPSDSALTELAKESFSEEFGARQVDKIIREIIQDLVIKAIENKNKKKKYTLKKEKSGYILV